MCSMRTAAGLRKTHSMLSRGGEPFKTYRDPDPVGHSMSHDLSISWLHPEKAFYRVCFHRMNSVSEVTG